VFAATPDAAVLVVEDDLPLRELFRHALAVSGHRVLIASNGIGALGLIDIERPAVVVLDLDLPLVNGWDIYRELRSRQETKKLPLIIVSAHDPEGIPIDDLAAFLKKPFDISELVLAVDRAVSSSRQVRSHT
jgi:DNA-binding response OmpR family regulator